MFIFPHPIPPNHIVGFGILRSFLLKLLFSTYLYFLTAYHYFLPLGCLAANLELSRG